MEGWGLIFQPTSKGVLLEGGLIRGGGLIGGFTCSAAMVVTILQYSRCSLPCALLCSWTSAAAMMEQCKVVRYTRTSELRTQRAMNEREQRRKICRSRRGRRLHLQRRYQIPSDAPKLGTGRSRGADFRDKITVVVTL